MLPNFKKTVQFSDFVLICPVKLLTKFNFFLACKCSNGWSTHFLVNTHTWISVTTFVENKLKKYNFWKKAKFQNLGKSHQISVREKIECIFKNMFIQEVIKTTISPLDMKVLTSHIGLMHFVASPQIYGIRVWNL